MEFLDPAYDLIRETFRRSKIAFMDRDAFKRFARSLGENSKLLMAEHQGVAQSYSLFAFSSPCAYWIYGGNIQGQHPGAMKLLQWEAILLFRNLGVRKFDFFGARINHRRAPSRKDQPDEETSWRYPVAGLYVEVLSPAVAGLAVFEGVRMLRGGDIVDQEGHEIEGYWRGPGKNTGDRPGMSRQKEAQYNSCRTVQIA